MVLLSLYEVMMVLASFGTLLIALLALIVTMINNKK
ncbi:putative holin-like toxin [Oceanobacillus limi]|nr:putative holin-like toxin [Oceanobacillus limi]